MCYIPFYYFVIISFFQRSTFYFLLFSIFVILSLISLSQRSTFNCNTIGFCNAVARGGAGGARAPPVFFLKSKIRPVLNVENKILSLERFETITFGAVGVVTRHLHRHRDEGANPWSSRDDDHFSILLWVHLKGVYLEAH